jgi:hypothetical protein
MIFLYFYEFRKGRKKKKEKLMWQSVPTRSGWSVPIEAARAAASTEADDTDRWAGSTAGHWSQPKTRAVVSSKPHHPSLFDSSH